MTEREKDFVVEVTADGSTTLYVPSLDEHYHSVNGAVQESKHVFIESGLKASSKQKLKILEVGFGTGLNAILTLQEARQRGLTIDYSSFELYPLSLEMVDQLNYVKSFSATDQIFFRRLHEVDWGNVQLITDGFTLTKIQADFSRLDIKFESLFDLIYFDAFAPDKQENMWTQAVFDYLYQITNVGGILTTYCAKGVVRRMMQQAGYRVERLPGPPGKREMLRAMK